MNRIVTLLFVLVIGASMSYGQRRVSQRSVDAGIMLGASNYQGELVQGAFKNFHFAGGLVGRYNLNSHFSLKGNAFYGVISGADSNSSDASAVQRNLSFRSELFEFAALLEWNMFAFDAMASRGKAFTPVVFAGVGVFKFNPKAYFEDTDPNRTRDFSGWVELQPIGTEGQGTTQFQDRKKYNLTQVSLPLGVGFKWRIARGWTFAAEYGIRTTFTDYIDDVSKTYVDPNVLVAAYGIESYSAQLSDRSPIPFGSREYDPLTSVGPQRGNSKSNDTYAYGGITITYTIFGNRVKCYQF